MTDFIFQVFPGKRGDAGSQIVESIEPEVSNPGRKSDAAYGRSDAMAIAMLA